MIEKKNTPPKEPVPPHLRNPKGRGGFGDHPEHRNPGGWKKSDTPRFKLELMMKLSEEELTAVTEDATVPLFEKKLAKAIKDGAWREIKEMIQEVYGKPQESVSLTNPDGALTPVVRIIDERPAPRNPDTK